MNDYVKARDNVFIEAVVNDNWNIFRDFAKKYNLKIPQKRKVMKAGVYKAVQYCTNIPDDVKEIAIEKCLKLGFNPFIDWRRKQ